ncbi:MAG: hypothetical protein CMK07_06665 [Ponticaulis sp.]|nr:hypothetical protein [Ponticaulis sp.]
MGGYGSGRRTRWASKTDEFHKIDLASFERLWFELGRNGTLTWSRGGHKTGSVGYQCGSDFLRLHYTSGRGENRQDIDERFRLSRTDQPFGGDRLWIICKCGRRCRVLYGGKRFRCRQCYSLTFASQYERFRVPGRAAAENVRRRLGFEAGFAYGFGSKPKGLHWRTYYRLRENDWAMSEAIDRALLGQFEPFLKR